MKHLARLCLCTVLLATALPAGAQTAAPQPAPSASPAAPASAYSTVLFARMKALNAGLRSFSASIHADVALHSFLPLHPTLDGTLYFKAPDREAAVFDTVPALASEFKKVYPRVPAPVSWPQTYTATQLSDDGHTAQFRLVPIKHGRVDHLDVSVDVPTATIVGYTWTYNDGGSIAFTQSFTTLAGNYLVVKQIGKVDLPSYKADVTNTLANYRLNVPVSDSVFAGS